MVRVAAKPSRSALRPAKASGCPTAAVAASATGSAPLQATSARTQPGRVSAPQALWRTGRRAADSRPYGNPSVMASPYTSPKALRAFGEALAGTFDAGPQAPPPSGRAMRAPTVYRAAQRVPADSDAPAFSML